MYCLDNCYHDILSKMLHGKDNILFLILGLSWLQWWGGILCSPHLTPILLCFTGKKAVEKCLLNILS
jgi:hypothetical protein